MLLIFAGIVVTGGLITAMKYLHYLVNIPLWIAFATAVISIGAWLLQRNLYSSAARNKMLLSNATLIISSLFFSKTISSIQESTNTHSLGHVAREIEKNIPSDAGWLTKFFNRASEFFRANNGEYRFSFILALLGLALSATIFTMALQRILGSLLIPSTSAGYVYQQKILNALNNVFVNSKIWGYCLMIAFAIIFWWSVTDSGAEFWLERVSKLGEVIKHASETAV